MNLTEEEKLILRAFVESSAFRVMCKIMEAEAKSCESQLLTSNNMNDVCRLQGRINGVRVLQNLPVFEAKKAEAEAKKKEEEQARALRKLHPPRQ